MLGKNMTAVLNVVQLEWKRSTTTSTVSESYEVESCILKTNKRTQK